MLWMICRDKSVERHSDLAWKGWIYVRFSTFMKQVPMTQADEICRGV